MRSAHQGVDGTGTSTMLPIGSSAPARRRLPGPTAKRPIVAKPSPFGPLEGFGSDARQVLRAAEVEAERLHHPRIGTEHLLLGLLVDEDTPVAQALRTAGVSISAARYKVEEA